MYISRNYFGYTRLEKGFKKALEGDRTLTSTAKKIAGCLKTTFRNSNNDIVGTVTEAADGRIIIKIATDANLIQRGGNGPAEEGLVSLGLSIKPKNEAQKKLQERIFRTAKCDTTRTGMCVDTEVVKPNGENTQYFYHRGVAAKYYETYPQDVLESPYDVSGQLTYLGGHPGIVSHYQLKNVWLKNQDTGMARTIKEARNYTECAH